MIKWMREDWAAYPVTPGIPLQYYTWCVTKDGMYPFPVFAQFEIAHAVWQGGPA